MGAKSVFYFPLIVNEGQSMASTVAPFVSVLPTHQKIEDTAVILTVDAGPGSPQGLHMFDGSRWRFAMPMSAVSEAIITGENLSLYRNIPLDVVLPPEVIVYRNGQQQAIDTILQGTSAVFAVRTPPASGGVGVVSVNGQTGAVIINANNLPGLSAVGKTGQYSDLIGAPAPYTLPQADVGTLGGVKISGATISIDGSGTINVASSLISTINGKLASVTNVGSGESLSSVVGNAVILKSIRGAGAVSVTSDSTSVIISTPAYTLPVATNATLGGVKVPGPNLSVDAMGVLDVSTTLINTINNKVNAVTNTGVGLPLSNTVGNTVALRSIIGTGSVNVTSDGFTATINGTSYVLPAATSTVLGGVKIGSGINVTFDGTISVPPGLQINDLSINSFETWSSFKIDQRLNAITKASLGLGSVDNTSDADKPVSTAQAAANANILASANSYTDSKVIGLWDDRGNYDASSNLWPSTGGSGIGDAILKGDIWTISVGGTLGGQPVVNRQTVRAMEDNPGQTSANWAVSTATPEVEDQIVAGVTNKAPSQNAVYLALQALPQLNDTTTSSLSYWSSSKTNSTINSSIATAIAGLPVGVSVSDEGVVSGATTTSFNFIGGGVTASNVGNAATINIPAINASVQAALNAKTADSTSLFTGGALSINVDNTKFNVASGTAQFMDYTNPTNPTSTIVNFPAFNAVTVTNMATQIVTYVGVQSNSTLVQQPSPFTPTQRRTIVPLGLVVHTNHLVVNAVNQIPTANRAMLNQLQDFIDSVGPLNTSGNIISANGANLAINKSSGTVFKYGSNFQTDPNNPHTLTLAAQPAATLRYRLANGTEGADRTTIDPTQWDNAGVMDSVGGSQFTIQHIYIFQSGLIRIQYGQATYGSLSAALDAVSYESFNVDANIAANGIALGLLVVRGNATDLTNTAQARFIAVSKFGSTTSTGLSSLSAADIAAILGYVPADAATTVTLTGVQTVSNKTYTNPTMNGFTEGGNTASGTSYSPTLTVTDHQFSTTGNATVTIPTPAQGKKFTLLVGYGGAHTLTFNGGTVRWVNNAVPTPTSVNGRYDYYEFKADRTGTFWVGRDLGRNI